MAFTGSITDITTDSAVLEAEFTGGDSAYANYRPLWLTIDGTTKRYDSDNKGGSDSYWTIDITGLDPGTTYEWEIQLGYYNGSTAIKLSLYDSGSFTTEEDITVAVEPWSWTASNGSATATQTKNAYAILQGTRAADDFSYKVWNDLVDKILEVREARGYSWSNGYATYANTKVASGDYLTAVRFNSIWHNIQHLKGTGLSAVNAGDEILGSYVVTLTDTLNAIIDNL